MQDINTALKQQNLANLDEEIASRRRLMQDMVGTLYPSIVRDELIKLNERREDVLRILEANRNYYK